MSAADKLTFDDALRIARGCHDYNGGHRGSEAHSIYHHGIQTVINALEGAAASGLWDTQTRALWEMGCVPAPELDGSDAS
jgi:hypothetical protein